MTREEAKNWIEDLISEMKEETSGNYPDPEYRDEVYEALEMAIQALEQEPRKITYEDVKGYCKPRCLTIIDNELLYELTHPKIKALEQEPSGDLISRQAVLDLIEHYNSDGLGAVFYGYEEGLKFTNAVNKLPSVNPQKTGHWIAIDEEPHEDYECDRCGYVCSTFTANIKPNEEYKFCPNCGAKMIEQKESEE